MSLENTNAADTTATAPAADVSAMAQAEPYSRVDAIDSLTNFYAAQEQGDQADEEETAPDENASAETAQVSAEEIEAEDGQADPETDSENSTKAEKAEKAEKPTETEAEKELTADDLGESDFDALETSATSEINPDDYPDAAALKAKYPRQQAALIEEAAKFSQKARRGDEILAAIGGESFAEPVAKMSRGVRDGDLQALFEGVVEAGSSDALLNVAGHSVFLSTIKAKEWANQTESPELAELGASMLVNADAVFEHRFGKGMNAERIETLANLERFGWAEAINKWKEQEYVDSDEFYELLAADKSPKEFLALKERQREVETELENARKQIERQETSKGSEAEKQFLTSVENNIEKILTENVWKQSVLKDIPSDTAELKETKAEFRQILIEAVNNRFRNSPEFKILSAAYKRGDAATLKFKESTAKAVNSVIASIKEKNAIYERTVAGLYGKRRNDSLAKNAPPKQVQSNTLAPTETTVSEKRPMTQDEIVEQMAKDIAALG